MRCKRIGSKNVREVLMNVLEASSAVLKNSTRVAWWGLAIGVFVGLHIAGALAKPLAGEVNRGMAAVNKGFSALRSKMAKKAEGEAGDLATEEPTEKKTAADKPFKIQVEDVAPDVPSEAARSGSLEEPETHPDIESRASKPESPGDAMPSLKWLKVDLLEEARKLGIAVRQTMTKKELLDAINTKR